MKLKQRHKNSFLWLSIIVTIIVLLIIAFAWIFDVRTINVPEDAVFKGTSKEAFWIQKVSCNDRIMRIRIFNDYDDKLIFDADFSTPMPCDNIIDSIRYYDKFSHKLVLFNGNELGAHHVYFKE